MSYVTFVSHRQTWLLYSGIGTKGAVLAEHRGALPLFDLSAAEASLLWVYGQRSDNQETVIQRLQLPELAIEDIAWTGGRVGALACAPDGQRAVVLNLPADYNEQTRLWLWHERSWTSVVSQVVPDISSKLAWLDGTRIVFESTKRQLTIFDLDAGSTETGPSGSNPTVARTIREWYAISGGQVLRFPFGQSFNNPPRRLTDFNFGDVIGLRVTHDGQVCTWTEPKFLYRSKGFIQQRGQRRRRFREIDEGVGAVLGPYTFP